MHIVQPLGKLFSKFGSRGSGAAQFAGPHYAAVNSHHNIIISDFHNHNIKVNTFTFDKSRSINLFQVFTKDGHFIFSFGRNGWLKNIPTKVLKITSAGEGNGQFNAPTGVAVDAQDNILVADWGNSRIQVNR